MKIKSLKLKNFQLFHNSEFTFDSTNVITGINYDDTEQSSNGSGKSTILNAIVFCLYGTVDTLNLVDLISLGAKEAQVSLTIEHDKSLITVIRSIPSNLVVKIGDEELQANTLKIKQQWLEEQFGTYDEFKKFRCIDSKKGINILDLGIITLRKTLMEFIDNVFDDIRRALLQKKQERELYNKDKRFYKFALSDKRLKLLEEGLKKRHDIIFQATEEADKQYKICNKLQSAITTKENLIAQRQKDLNQTLNKGICPILKTKCSQLTKEITPEQQKQINTEVDNWQKEIQTWCEELDNESDLQQQYSNNVKYLERKEKHTSNYLMKLKEAFKFADYKYTNKDVMLYAEAIKVIDAFAGYYINEWLSNLAIIINDLLRNLNLEVTFTMDKEFLTIKNGESKLKYDQLSAGQKIFLGSIFKLSILLQNNKLDGILLIDEGISNLDKINLQKFLSILQTLNFQSFLVYQNIEALDNINLITVQRKNGESTNV